MAGSYWLTVLPDLGKFGKDVEKATKDIKVEPKVEPKVDRRGAEKAGRETGEAVKKGVDRSGLGTVVGSALGSAAGVTAIKAATTVGDRFGGQLVSRVGAAAQAVPNVVKTRIAPALDKVMAPIGVNAGGLLMGALTAASVGGVVKFASELSPAIGNAMREAASWVQAGVNDISSMVGGLRNLLGGDGGFAAPALDAVQGSLDKISATLDTVTHATEMGTQAVSLFGRQGKIVTGITAAWNAVLLANPITLVIGAVVAAVAAVGAALALFFTKTEAGRQLWSKIWGGLKAAVEGVWGAIKAVGAKVGEAFNKIKDVVEPVIGWLVGKWLEGWTFVKDHFGQAWENIKSKFDDIRPALQPIVDLFQKIGDVAVSLWNKVKGPLESLWSKIVEVAQRVWPVVQPVLKGLAIAVGVVAALPLAAIGAAFVAVGGAIMGALMGLSWLIDKATNLFPTVGAIIGAVIDAITMSFRSVIGVAKLLWDAVTAAWDGIVAATEFLWNGIKSGFDKITGFVKGLKDTITRAAKGMWDGLKSGLKAVLNSIVDMWNGLAERLSFKMPDFPGVPRRGETIQVLPRLPRLATGGGPVRGPGSGTSDSILARLSHGEYVVNAAATRQWLPLLEAINKAPGFAAGGLTPHASTIRSDIMQFWPQITDIGGWRPEDGYGEHSTGNALDVMIPGWNTPAGKALGDAVAGWALSNADALGLSWVIWQQRIHNPGDDVGRMMEDRGSPTQNHMDHVHIFMNNAPDEKLKLTSPTLRQATSPSPSGGSAPSAAQGGISLGSSSSSSGGGSSMGSLGSAVSGGDGSDLMGEMSDILKGGIKENLFGGTGLSDPSEWPNVKSAMAGLQFLLNLVGLQMPGGAGGQAGGVSPFNPQSGSPALSPGDFNPAIAGSAGSSGGGLPGLSGFMPNAMNPAQHGAQQGAAPGPGGDTYNITTHESTQTVQKSVDAVKSANQRVPVTVPRT